MGKRVKAPPYTKLRGGWYYEHFTVSGRRFRAALDTESPAEAAAITAKRRGDAVKVAEGIIEKNAILRVYTVSQMLGTYQKATASYMQVRAERIEMFFGAATKMHEIEVAGDTGITQFKAWLQDKVGPLTPEVINGHLRHLRAALYNMRDHHGGRSNAIKGGARG